METDDLCLREGWRTDRRLLSFDGPPLRYIQKIHQGRHVYLFANPGSTPVTTKARLRGRLVPQFWNPHDGTISAAVVSTESIGDQAHTLVEITLEPTRSIFVVGPEKNPG